jgi:imidazolonepropionase-like amidohydrolase
MYVLPGLIDLHGHYSKVGIVPFEYIHKLYLACGVTSLRDVGSDYDLSIPERSKSQEGVIAAPRIFLYMSHRGTKTHEEARQKVREIKERGGDGVKIYGMDRDLMRATLDEAKKLGLRVAHHVAVEETDAWDDIEFGTTSIEHWYGVPDAALRGSQNFPHWYNYSDENERFRYAGHLWREADPEKLKEVYQAMVDAGVAWNTTFAVYEANRDLVRAQNKPWYKDYLHPALEEFWRPNPEHHASYFWEWTTEDEVFWREDYKLWMKGARDFANLGGTICVGDDAGSLYTLYGFGLIRELELHQEAGFHPIDIIMHATGNNAKTLGMEDKLGRVREGFLADLLIIDRNPLKNFKYLYPDGVTELRDGKMMRGGGVKWTIKDGIVYHAPTMAKDVKAMVAKAKVSR